MGSTASVYRISEGCDPSSAIGTHVDMMLDETVQSVSSKIVSKMGKISQSRSVPHLSDRSPRDNLIHAKSLVGIKNHSSLRLHAVRHHSRQRNTYISSSAIMKFVAAKAPSNAGSSSSSLVGGKSSPITGNSAASICMESIAETKTKPLPTQSLGKKLNLKLQINDEDDWIQVMISNYY